MNHEKKKRNIFGELVEGVEAMRKHREGKLTLRSHKVEPISLPNVTGKLIRDIRETLQVSQGVFANLIKVNPRTLANWEQDRSKPNGQAVTLILLVQKYPDTLNRLKDI